MNPPIKRVILPLAAFIVVLDQISKAMVIEWIPLHSRIRLVDGFLALTHVRNRGMAFGLFQGVESGWLRWVLVAVALGAVMIIWSYARHETANPLVLVAFGAILGGAVGNLIDRLRFGYVVDFVLAHWGDAEWPAFNVADSAITMGGIALFLALARENSDERDSEPAEDAAAPSTVAEDRPGEPPEPAL